MLDVDDCVRVVDPDFWGELMYIRLTRAQLDPSTYAVTTPLRTELAAAVRAMPGCRRYELAANRKTGSFITIGAFDTEEHANYPRERLADILRRLQANGLGQLQPSEIYEVLGP